MPLETTLENELPRMKIMLFDLELYLTYSIDISFLVKKEFRNLMELERGKTTWVKEIQSAFNMDNLAYKKPKQYVPEFDRIPTTVTEKKIFSDFYVREFAPLEFQCDKMSPRLTKNFKVADYSVKLTKDGVLLVRFHVIQAKSKNKSYMRMDVVSLISRIDQIRQKLNNSFIDVLQKFASCWSSTLMDIRLQDHIGKDALEKAYTYEIILFDYIVRNKNLHIKIKDMYTIENIDLLRQLVGLARMSLPETFNSYSWDFLKKYVLENDIGNRDDELWLITEKRILRFHPMRKDIRWETWLRSAVSGIDILLAKRTLMERITDYMDKEILSLRSEISDLSKKKIAYKDITRVDEQLNQQMVNLVNISQVVLDPLRLERHITDDFYLKLAKRIIDHFKLENLSRMVINYYEELYNLSATVKGMAETKREARRIEAIELLSLIFAAMTLSEILSNLIVWWLASSQMPVTIYNFIWGFLLSVAPAIAVFVCVYFLYLRGKHLT